MNYYEETLAKIKQLLTEQKYEEALGLIAEELKVPYVPLEFEKELRAQQQIALSKTKQDTSSLLSGEEVFKILNNPHVGDAEKVGLFYQLEKTNLRNFLPQTEAFLNSQVAPELKTILVYLLASQEIDHEFSYQGLEGKVVLNPKTFDFKQTEKFVEQLTQLLEQVLPSDYPQLLEMMKIVVANFYYKLFPLLKSYDINKLSEAIKNRILIVNGIANEKSVDDQVLTYEKLLENLKIV